jgi:hypothetical protein
LPTDPGTERPGCNSWTIPESTKALDAGASRALGFSQPRKKDTIVTKNSARRKYLSSTAVEAPAPADLWDILREGGAVIHCDPITYARFVKALEDRTGSLMFSFSPFIQTFISGLRVAPLEASSSSMGNVGAG